MTTSIIVKTCDICQCKERLGKDGTVLFDKISTFGQKKPLLEKNISGGTDWKYIGPNIDLCKMCETSARKFLVIIKSPWQLVEWF